MTVQQGAHPALQPPESARADDCYRLPSIQLAHVHELDPKQARMTRDRSVGPYPRVRGRGKRPQWRERCASHEVFRGHFIDAHEVPGQRRVGCSASTMARGVVEFA